jgi:hypothetical protein
MGCVMIEIVDVTSDEMYFTLAVYSDFETAKKQLIGRIHQDVYLTDSAENDGYEKIQIRQHIEGWGKGHKTLFTVSRTRDYDEAWDKMHFNDYYVGTVLRFEEVEY